MLTLVFLCMILFVVVVLFCISIRWFPVTNPAEVDYMFKFYDDFCQQDFQFGRPGSYTVQQDGATPYLANVNRPAWVITSGTPTNHLGKLNIPVGHVTPQHFETSYIFFDGLIEFSITRTGNNNVGQLEIRFMKQDANNYWALEENKGGGPNFRLYKFVGGVPTNLDNVNTELFTDGVTHKLQISRTETGEFTVLLDDALVLSGTDVWCPNTIDFEILNSQSNQFDIDYMSIV